MTEFKYNRVLFIFIVIGLLAALVIGWQRHRIEENGSRVEMVIDYQDILDLADTEGMPVPLLMRQFRDAGITSLAIYDTTLEQLQQNGKLTALSGAELLSRYSIGEVDKFKFSDPSGQISPNRVYIFPNIQDGFSQSDFQEVESDLVERLGAARVHQLVTADNHLGVAIDAKYVNVFTMDLGLSSQQMREATDNGFLIVARPTNYVKAKPADVNAVFARLKKFNNVSGVMFAGLEVIGFPDSMSLTARHFREQGLTLYMIEHPLQLQFLKQEGLLPLAKAINYQVSRVYVIPKDEQPDVKLEDAIHRWVLCDQERNIRVNLLRKFDKPEPGMSLIETNLFYVKSIKDGLLDSGFVLGRAAVYPSYYPPVWLLTLIFVGATAGGILLLTLIRPFAVRYQYILLVVISLLLIFPLLKGGGLMARQAVAIASACIFPVLGMTWQFDRWRRREPSTGSMLSRIVTDGLSGILVTSAISLIGGFYVAGILADIRFMMEIEIYRGVKLTFVLPLILITLSYLVRFDLFAGNKDSKQSIGAQLAKVLNYPIYFKTLIFALLGVVGAWIFIGRSGHTAGVPVPAFEVKLRTFLENVMYARPREKEFIVGHPAFFLAVMAFYRNWPRFFHYILAIVATIGQDSMVETFAHIRTPLYMSFIRGIDGLVLGIIIGIIAVIAVQVMNYLSFLLGRRSADE